MEDEEKHPVFLLKVDSTHGDAMSQMNFDQVKDYLQGRGEPSIARDFGGMNLAEMKSNFGDNELELKRLQKDLVQKRQREMADDIRQLQVQQQKKLA